MSRLRIIRVLAMAAIAGSSCVAIPASRGARPVPDKRDARTSEAFDPKQSAGLFVGVSRFPYDATLTDVRYAVDDAVDLAHVLALDDKVRLVDPTRVILALSGEPQKTESRQNLARLVTAGAQVRTAGLIDVLTALDEQARAAGGNGLFVTTFATHGVSYDGTQYLLTASSALRHQETALSESKIRDIASRSGAARSLILVDACRERLRSDQRNGRPDSRSAASLLQAMSGTQGQVVLSAAAAGQYAYDDDTRGNGVFTAAVIDGLRCQAATNERGLVTVDALATFIEERVLAWIRSHKDIDVARATQVMWEGQAKTMPVAACRGNAPIAPASGCMIAIGSSPSGAMVTVDGRVVGITPRTIRVAREQRTEVVLVKSGYRARTADVDCSRSEPVFVTLLPHSEEVWNGGASSPAEQHAKTAMVLVDRFDDNRNRWLVSDDPLAPAGVQAGRYVLASKPGEWRFTTIPVAIDPGQPFRISAKVTKTRGDDDYFYGLMWGVGDANQFFNFAITGSGHVAVTMKNNGVFTDYNQPALVNPHVHRGDATNLLTVARLGDRVRFSINGQQVHEMPFQPFFGSAVGFIVYHDVHLTLDDLEIEGVPRR